MAGRVLGRLTVACVRGVRALAALAVVAVSATPSAATAADAGALDVPPGFTESIDLGAVRVGEKGTWVPVRYDADVATHVGSTVGIEIGASIGHSCDPLGTIPWTCAVDARFEPTSRGPYTGYVYFLTTAGDVTIPAVGVGLDTEVSLTPVWMPLGDVVVGATSAPQQLTFANVGDYPVNVTGIAVSPPFEHSGGTCSAPATLPVGSSCTIGVVFRPTATGSASGTVTVSTLEEPAAQAQVTGNGLSNTPSLSVSPASHTFPGTPVGATSAPTTFVITNTGHVPVALGGSAITTTSADWVLGASTCTGTLAPATTCTQAVSFAPSAAGDRTGTLRVETGATPATASLSGFGETRTYTLTPDEIDFGGVRLGASVTREVVVSNTGNVDLLLSSVVLPGSVNAVTSSCADPIPPSGTCTISLTFAPTQPGLMSGSLSVYSSSGDLTASLRGVGEPLVIDPAGVDVGVATVGHGASASVTVRNLAAEPVPLTVSAAGPGVETATCPDPLPAGGECELVVTLVPAAVGPATGEVVVSAALAGGVTQTLTVPVMGEGAPAQLVGTAVDFGEVAATRTATAPLTITNTGAAAVEIGGLTVPAPFAVSDPAPCATVLAPAATCTVTVAFTPSAPGPVTASVTVSHPGGSTALPVTGTGVRASIRADVDEVDFGETPAGEASATRTVVITNPGPEVAVTRVQAPRGFVIVDDGCTGTVLATGGSCEIVVRFEPTGPGATAGDLVVTGDAAGAALAVGLRGFAPDGQVVVGPATATFGSVVVGGRSVGERVTVTNRANLPVRVTKVTFARPAATAAAGTATAAAPPIVSGAFELDVSGCVGVTLAPGAGCALTAVFAPTAPGEFTASVLVETDRGTHTVTLRGTAVAAPTSTVPTTTVPGPPTTPAGRLPATGSTTGPATVLVGAALVGAGASVVAVTRRRPPGRPAS